jgi:hypothetical protein
LGHNPAYGRALLQQINIESGIGQIQGRLHPCNPTAYNQYGSPHIIRHRMDSSNKHELELGIRMLDSYLNKSHIVNSFFQKGPQVLERLKEGKE